MFRSGGARECCQGRRPPKADQPLEANPRPSGPGRCQRESHTTEDELTDDDLDELEDAELDALDDAELDEYAANLTDADLAQALALADQFLADRRDTS